MDHTSAGSVTEGAQIADGMRLVIAFLDDRALRTHREDATGMHEARGRLLRIAYGRQR